MRILYVIDSMRGGGAESVLCNLVLHMRDHNQSVDAEIATLYEIGHFGKHLADMGVPVHCFSLESQFSLLGAVELIRLVHSIPCDVIHTHLFPANYFASIASLYSPQVPWIYTEHSVWNRRRKFRALRYLEAAIYSRFCRVVAVSDLVADSLVKWIPSTQSRLCVVPNAVPLPSDGELQSLKSTDSLDLPVLLFVGRLEYVKGVDVLLESLAKLQTPDYKLQIVGKGSLRTSLESLANRLGICHEVEFLGFCSDVRSLMANASYLVVPSRWEGLPLALLEAMSLGIPVIASAVGGMPEVVAPGVTGWLVPPEDPNALAEVLTTALKNPDIGRQMGANARRKIQQDYSIQVMARRLLDLYSEVVQM